MQNSSLKQKEVPGKPQDWCTQFLSFGKPSGCIFFPWKAPRPSGSLSVPNWLVSHSYLFVNFWSTTIYYTLHSWHKCRAKHMWSLGGISETKLAPDKKRKHWKLIAGPALKETKLNGNVYTRAHCTTCTMVHLIFWENLTYKSLKTNLLPHCSQDCRFRLSISLLFTWENIRELWRAVKGICSSRSQRR